MNRGFLIPANSKKSMLYFSMFNKFDLILFGIGIGFSFFGILILPVENIMFAILAILPACVTGFLVFPVPHYHNVLTFLMSAWSFISERRMFIWKGWCVSSEESDKE